LDELAGKVNRKARFRTIVALVDGDEEFTFEGICNGKIIEEQRGSEGFGYDPIFMPVDYEHTFAELDSSKKNLISHRGKAVEKFVKFLKEM